LAASCSFGFAAPQPWVQVTSPHFTVYSDAGDTEARRIADQFERMRWMFQNLFPKAKVDPALPIVVVAAKDQKAFQAFEPAAYLAKGQIVIDGVFQKTQDTNYILLRLDAADEHPYAAVYHECTHLEFGDAMNWMPLWLNEGLAGFFENTAFHDRDVLLGQANQDHLQTLRRNHLLPLAALFKVDTNSPTYHEEQKGSLFYAESWALTRYLELTDHEKNTHRLQDYLALVSQHRDPVAAAEKAFGDLKKLQTALGYSIRLAGDKQFALPGAAAPLNEAAYQSKPLTQADADAVRADVLVFVGRTAEARTLLDAVLKAAPDNAQAHETMGYLANRDGDKKAARKWYEQAVKLNPQSCAANYYAAVLSMGEGILQRNGRIEANLRAAIHINPRFAPAYDQLAVFLAMQHKNIDEAHTLNLQAIALDPENLPYRINAATVMMTIGQYDGAADLLRDARKVASNPKEVALVDAQLKQVLAVQALHAPKGLVTTTATPQDIAAAEAAVTVDVAPKHPTEPGTGPKLTAMGVLQSVQCSFPSVMEFQVQTAKKTLSLYNNNYFKIDFTTLGVTLKDDMNPCKDIEGMKAQVQYVESSDKSVDGQAMAIELRKEFPGAAKTPAPRPRSHPTAAH
jgi:tetratricopeptide (TPR) repeat protein